MSTERRALAEEVVPRGTKPLGLRKIENNNNNNKNPIKEQ